MDRIREASPGKTCNSINLLQASSYDRVWKRWPLSPSKNNPREEKSFRSLKKRNPQKGRRENDT